MVKLLSFLAMIVFIPLRSRQHFIPLLEVNACVLADICNHTWINECGYYEPKDHHRIFTDECDMYEYNCDHNVSYRFTNYSACFGSAICETVPSLLTRVQGFYIYYADGRRVLRFNPMTTHYTPQTEKKTTQTISTHWNDRRRYTPWKTGSYKPWTDDTTSCAPCKRKRSTPRTTLHQYWPALELPPTFYAHTPAKTNKKPKKRTMERTIKRTADRKTTTKPTTQVLRTGTIGTVILKKITVWKNGKLVYKVIKGFKAPTRKGSMITTDHDSDFLE